MTRKFQDSLTDFTYFRIETGYGLIWVLIQDGGHCYVESADRVYQYDISKNGSVPSGSPLMVKDIDYSFYGHFTHESGQWACRHESWGSNVTVHGAGWTELRAKKIVNIVERALNDWERIYPEVVAIARKRAELININNEIECAERDLEKASKQYDEAHDKLRMLLGKELEIHGDPGREIGSSVDNVLEG